MKAEACDGAPGAVAAALVAVSGAGLPDEQAARVPTRSAPDIARRNTMRVDSGSTVDGTASASMRSSGRELRERGRGGAPEIGLCRIGGRQGIGVLAFGGDERAAGIEHIESGGAAEPVADGRDPERLAGGGKD